MLHRRKNVIPSCQLSLTQYPERGCGGPPPSRSRRLSSANPRYFQTAPTSSEPCLRAVCDFPIKKSPAPIRAICGCLLQSLRCFVPWLLNCLLILPTSPSAFLALFSKTDTFMAEHKETSMRRTTGILSLLFLFLYRAPAQSIDLPALITLAQTPPEQFHTQLAHYLTTHTNRFDVAAAATNGWQACLTAMIINSRLDHPAEYQVVDTPTPSGNISLETSYMVLSISNKFDEASVYDRLWKGGQLSGRDMTNFGLTNEFGLLPGGYPEGILSRTIWSRLRLSNVVSTSLLINILHSDAPSELKGFAAYGLTQRDTADAESALLPVLQDTNLPIMMKRAVFFGIEFFAPTYGWQLMSDSRSNWEFETNGNLSFTGFNTVGTLTDLGAANFIS